VFTFLFSYDRRGSKKKEKDAFTRGRRGRKLLMLVAMLVQKLTNVVPLFQELEQTGLLCFCNENKYKKSQ